MKFMMNTNKIAVFLILILSLSFCSAQILVSTTVDKGTFYENEVGMLMVKIQNDYPEELKNVYLRIEGGEGVRFIENFAEQRILIQETGQIRSEGSKEIYVKMKVISVAESQPKIYVYYGTGDTLQNASVTFVNAEKSPVTVKTNARRISSQEGEKIVVDFSLINYSSETLAEVVAEIIAPENYLIRTPPFAATNVTDGNIIEEQFDLIPPPGTSGVQTIILSYGYIDTKGAHYFEEVFEVNIERTNQLIFAVIGIVILVIAGYLYILRDKRGPTNGLQGTEEKAEAEGAAQSKEKK